jgi:hypothetical protein
LSEFAAFQAAQSTANQQKTISISQRAAFQTTNQTSEQATIVFSDEAAFQATIKTTDSSADEKSASPSNKATTAPAHFATIEESYPFSQ